MSYMRGDYYLWNDGADVYISVSPDRRKSESSVATSSFP